MSQYSLVRIGGEMVALVREPTIESRVAGDKIVFRVLEPCWFLKADGVTKAEPETPKAEPIKQETDRES